MIPELCSSWQELLGRRKHWMQGKALLSGCTMHHKGIGGGWRAMLTEHYVRSHMWP